MTSCDEGYAKLLPPQMLSIKESLIDKFDYDVHLYIVHNRVEQETAEALKRYSEQLGINFVEIKIDDIAAYEKLQQIGGRWPFEAYMTLNCHEYLPHDIDRIMYFDSADTLIIDDIEPYYFADFENNWIITHPRQHRLNYVLKRFIRFKRKD